MNLLGTVTHRNTTMIEYSAMMEKSSSVALYANPTTPLELSPFFSPLVSFRSWSPTTKGNNNNERRKEGVNKTLRF